MAWTSPRTWVTSELTTAAMLNEQIRDNMNAVLPIGTLILRVTFYSTVEQAFEGRWLMCNGAAVSRTTYAALFSYLNGISPALPFGGGDGTTTFNLPDLRGRAAFASGEHASVDTPGDSDGVAVGSRTPVKTFTTTPLAGGGTAALNGPTTQTTPYQVVGSYLIKYT